jgi:hypothetical protein
VVKRNFSFLTASLSWFYMLHIAISSNCGLMEVVWIWVKVVRHVEQSGEKKSTMGKARKEKRRFI